MRNAYAVEAVRAAERALMDKLPPGTLMQRAAAGLASVCARVLPAVYGARVTVLAGSGDNGGDALYAGQRLARRGAQVTAVTAGSRVHEAGSGALRAAGGRFMAAGDPDVAAVIGAADLVLDGFLGIGGRGGLREAQASLAGLLEQARGSGHGPVVVAVDLPSGVDASTGEVAGAAVRADVTVTFGTFKPGLFIDPGAAHAGVVELIDIGLGPYLPAPGAAAPGAADIAALLPGPGRDSDKYRRGVLGIVAGSEQFTGAAALAVGGAIRGGAGMVRLVSEELAVAVVRQHWPEAVITVAGGAAGEEVRTAGRVQAWLAGPGMGTGELAYRRLRAVLETGLPVLVDADGLTLIARDPELLAGRSAPALLTPHAGELARLLGGDAADVEARRLDHACQAAARFGATVLLKGSTTVIAPAPGSPQPGPVYVNPTGTSWLATAGTGDVLSGLAGSLLAQGLPVSEAAIAAAYLHGLAARRAAAGTGTAAGDGTAAGAGTAMADPAMTVIGAQAPIGAGDVIGALPGAIRSVHEAARR